MNFAQLLGAADWRADGLALFVPADWHQGRTAYGGFSAALALAAAQHVAREAHDAGLPPLRSAQVSFVGPLAGEIRVAARVLRAGRNVVWVAAEITDAAGMVGLTASFAFMAQRDSQLALNNCPMPEGLIAPEDAAPVVHAMVPDFMKMHFEARFAQAAKPGKSGLAWWLRVSEADGLGAGLDPMVHLLLVADGPPPGVLPLLGGRVPISSMGWQINLLSPAPVTRDGWWLLASTADYAADGTASERMQMWNRDGVPMYAGMQSIAVFG